MSDSDVSSLSWDTILEYNLANAFAVPSSEIEDDTLSKFKNVTTTTYSESTGLLDDMTENLETIQTNLQYMLNYAIDGSEATTDKDRQTAYAQLRSLSAGIDTVVRDYSLEDLTLFTGRSYDLSYDGGTALAVSLDNLASSDDNDDTTDDEGLNLATNEESAFVEISYDYLNTLRNASTDIAGLDITSATTSDGDPTVAQLSDGEYQVEVAYEGAKSTIYIESLDGNVLDTAENVDLTGTGQMEVAFGCGITLSIEKTYCAYSDGTTTYDKADYSDGPISLYANLSYESNVQHNLDDGTGSEVVANNSVSIASGSTLKGTTGTLKVTASTASVYDGRTAMETGQYNAKIQYAGDSGAKSSIWLYDQNGTLVSTVRNIDLSGEDAVSVDLGTGVAITLDPTDFTSSARTYNTYLNYTASEEAYENFDYDAYYDIIYNALTTIQENLDVVSQAQEELESRYSTIQSALDYAATSGKGTASSDLLTVLAGGSSSGVSADSLFGAISGSSSSDDDSSTSTVSTTDGNIIGTLSDTVSTLSESEDYAVLALYYK